MKLSNLSMFPSRKLSDYMLDLPFTLLRHIFWHIFVIDIHMTVRKFPTLNLPTSSSLFNFSNFSPLANFSAQFIFLRISYRLLRIRMTYLSKFDTDVFHGRDYKRAGTTRRVGVTQMPTQMRQVSIPYLNKTFEILYLAQEGFLILRLNNSRRPKSKIETIFTIYAIHIT